ncbi:hypothetical protein [Edaphobacter sp. 12200R-103]|uniref:hypothetical protein n=1 Tax=Edaphobacter sp. 12200R-103 TaxID=2703788 RepID=UPI00138B1EDE|nr:hypothetical protein [Edaphobacter sp. 12200R-103]QHS51541.1 hypothetical protein GWR55_07110 [Edaphobacter sp. 12200R-103]
MDETKKSTLSAFEIQQTGEAIEKLSSDPKAFSSAYEAFLAGDAEKFAAALDKVGIRQDCRWVCRFFCRKRCIGVCRKFCPQTPAGEVNTQEILDFAKAVGPLLRKPDFVERLFGIIQSGDVEHWGEEIKRNKLERFCYQLCMILCAESCHKQCIRVCPPDPLITRVGSIPTTQVDSQGFGSGPSIPNFYVPSPNPAAGVGDHPFGGMVWLMGIFNMPTAVEYLVEVSNTPNSGYSPILVGPQGGYDQVPPQPPPPVPPDPFIIPPPFQYFRTRSQSTGGDPGWFRIDQLTDSDGGRTTTGEKTLLMWPTSTPDGVFYLRLRVRDAAMNTRVSSPQAVRLDNTGPFPLPRPTISLQLQKPDGTRVPLKCGKVRKGDGLILVTIQAYDPNMSSVSVTARGNSGLSVPVVDTSSTPLSKTYNGNTADQGYVVPTEFLWDPWSDPNIVPCCYLVYVEINDRTITNNSWSGGHYNAGWEAIEIGI